MKLSLILGAVILLPFALPAHADSAEQAAITAFLPVGKTLLTATQQELLWATNLAIMADPCHIPQIAASVLEPLTLNGPARSDRAFLASYVAANAIFDAGGPGADPNLVAEIAGAVALDNAGTTSALPDAEIAKIAADAVIIAPQDACLISATIASAMSNPQAFTQAALHELTGVPKADIGLFVQGAISVSNSPVTQVGIAVGAIKTDPRDALAISEAISQSMVNSTSQSGFMESMMAALPSASAQIAAGFAAGDPDKAAALTVNAITLDPATQACWSKIADAACCAVSANEVGDIALSVGAMLAPSRGNNEIAMTQLGSISTWMTASIVAKNLSPSDRSPELAAMASSLAMGLTQWVYTDPTDLAQSGRNDALAKAAAIITANAIRADPGFARDIVGSVISVFGNLPADVFNSMLPTIEKEAVAAAGPKYKYGVYAAIADFRMGGCSAFPIGPINGQETAVVNL